MLINEYNDLMACDVEVFIKTSASLRLLKMYSMLYLNGSQPRTCEKSIRNYYNELKTTGKMKAEQMEEVQNRTNVPNWEGLRYIHGDHYSNLYITDRQAINLLTLGLLNETDFKVLPKEYISAKTAHETKPIEQPKHVIEVPKQNNQRKRKH